MRQREHLKNLLVQRGLAQSSSEAERLIIAAQVQVDGSTVCQAGMLVRADALIHIKESKKYVSRGGYKLEGALRDFAFEPGGLNCIDAGASSGGFTDCLLKHGAAQVTAVDVGYGQFDWTLRGDSRVKLFERTNIALVDPACLGAPFALMVVDLSFTSLSRLAPQLACLLESNGNGFVLVKPQFELPKECVKDGVVHSFDLHVQALAEVAQSFENNGLAVRGLSFSCLLGPKGNTEFWIWAVKSSSTATIKREDIMETVCRAHEELLDQCQN
ncbi:MAG: TlyA family RNA methyltransferase [Coriobacteriia bacterium]|nr:TlyA family RNA methyltransferase [Coriobacteriia bacterium]